MDWCVENITLTEPIASFILKWGINGSSNYEILEPSCGDGVFLEQLKENNHKFKSVTAIEFDEVEADKADKIKLQNKNVINTDFLCIVMKLRNDLI